MTRQQKLARRMRERLDANEFIDAIALSRADVDNLNAISAGLPVKGAGHILRAIGLKADLLVQRPAQRMDVRSVNLQVVDPYSLPPAELAECPALPPAAAEPSLAAPGPRSLAERKRAEWERDSEARAAAQRLSPAPPPPPPPASA